MFAGHHTVVGPRAGRCPGLFSVIKKAPYLLKSNFFSQQKFHYFFQPTNSVYQFLSGVRVTPETPFLDLSGRDIPIILEIHHYMHFAVGMYGWPMYLRKNTGIATLRLCSSLRLEKQFSPGCFSFSRSFQNSLIKGSTLVLLKTF